MAKRYHAHFTSGALLQDDILQVLTHLAWDKEEERELKIDPAWLQINSYKARQTTAREIRRRMKAVQDPGIWETFQSHSDTDQKVWLYYACCKAYPLLLDFHLEIVLNKWRSFNLEIESQDFLNFLYQKSIEHPELDDWSEQTQAKLAQVAIKMLKEAGLVKDGQLQKVQANNSLWERFVGMGERWFLELMFLNADEREMYLNP